MKREKANNSLLILVVVVLIGLGIWIATQASTTGYAKARALGMTGEDFDDQKDVRETKKQVKRPRPKVEDYTLEIVFN